METNLNKLRGLLIGAGVLGQNLYSLCKKQGILFSAVLDIKKKISPIPQNNCYTSIKQIPVNEINFIAICVQDKNIQSVVSDIFDHFTNLEGIYCFHTSGAMGSEVLEKLKANNAYTGSFHPLMTFNSQQLLQSLQNVPIAIEGDKQTVELLTEFAKQLQAHPIFIPPEIKTIYHLTGVFTSNFLFSLLKPVENLIDHMNENGIKISMKNMEPIIQQTLNTVITSGISNKTVSGPVNRKDFSILEKHLNELKDNFPEHVDLYKILSLNLSRFLNYNNEEYQILKKTLNS